MHRNVEDTIIILNEGMGPHPRCRQCGMFVPQEILATGHLGTKIYRRGVERKCLRIAANVTWVVSGTEFRARDQVLEKVYTFKYLDRMVCFDDSYWSAVTRNLQRAWRKWGR